MEPSAIQSLVDSVGLPVTIIVALGLSIWRAFRWIGPRIEALFTAHLALVEDLRTTNAEANHEILRVATQILARLKEPRS